MGQIEEATEEQEGEADMQSSTHETTAEEEAHETRPSAEDEVQCLRSSSMLCLIRVFRN